MKKDPTNAWTDLYDFAAKIRAVSLYYSEIEDFDVNSRLKWTGMLSRFKRTPGRFMMRLRTPNGVVKSDTLRLFADTIEPYGDDLGVMDITTRQNVQLRGLTLEDGADLTKKLQVHLEQGEELSIDTKVDPRLVGGFTVAMGEDFFDLSLMSRIRAMEAELSKPLGA